MDDNGGEQIESNQEAIANLDLPLSSAQVTPEVTPQDRAVSQLEEALARVSPDQSEMKDEDLDIVSQKDETVEIIDLQIQTGLVEQPASRF